jgi:hypothetical protein
VPKGHKRHIYRKSINITIRRIYWCFTVWTVTLHPCNYLEVKVPHKQRFFPAEQFFISNVKIKSGLRPFVKTMTKHVFEIYAMQAFYARCEVVNDACTSRKTASCPSRIIRLADFSLIARYVLAVWSSSCWTQI